METNCHHNTGGEQRFVRNNHSFINNTYYQHKNLPEALNMESSHYDDPSIQREYVMNTLANDESLLSDFLHFHQQQMQHRYQKTGHNVSIP
ncbi:unnamed protein product [Rotaria magnacalcarata]|uniref:Uncharacterized protein n=1 Tax=Rotaria magnacalcarata TaxID=392030 RepID=A0A816KVF8_9BILA|nr:unnamed protein product [Rotaria magnacalcarata]CAF1928368.1 unnamed protein product [Rotaria magnacalcarata]CAF3943684.1 unnamed protein product [Rotaria magnacalcarata]CAF4151123.1 unnamed protein product [Rotaria magnacalcarata]CAF4251420.1 unnamed protein product [Rotaria magnacalcarata]